MNNRGNLGGIAFFVALLLGLIIMAPILLKVGTTILSATSNQLAKVDTSNRSSDSVNYVQGQLTGTMDWMVMFFVMINILLLLVTAFLIDVHPAFLVMYIIGAFAMVITLPYTASAGEKIYSMSQFSSGADNVIQYIPMTEFLLNHFGVVIVGVFFLTAVIMYVKIRSTSGTGGNF